VTRRSLFLLLGLAALLGSGCSVVRGTRTPDGALVVSSYRALWKSEAIEFTTTPGTNFSVTLRIGKSRTDEQSVALATEAAVKALVRP
jgi:hypothetical protein